MTESPAAPTVVRLKPEQASAIVACFRRVYGESYGNPLFYEAAALDRAMANGQLCCVGALAPDGRLLGHMAMSLAAPGDTPELGNTVVDPEARGAGVAWQVGAALTDWCRELGFAGFLHYPTANHHIMQRQSVKRGFETGLMLGYIPADTDGKTGVASAALRQTATIVYEPLADAPALSSYLSDYGARFIRAYARACGLQRDWQPPQAPGDSVDSLVDIEHFPRRGLARCTVCTAGADIDSRLAQFAADPSPCLQLDLCMSDPGLDAGVSAALARGFVFSGWLPGFHRGDVLRLQKADPATTNFQPELVNPAARELLSWIVG